MVKKSTKIYVGNLSEAVDNANLQELFEKYGEVKECDVIKNYGFVHMSIESDAKEAIDALNNSEFLGSKITVELSHSKVRQRPGMGGSGQCYRCGRQGHWSKECPRNPSAQFGMGPPMFPSYGDRMSRYSMDRPFGNRFSSERSYADLRMRPYPDPYERRQFSAGPMASGPIRDEYLYYRRQYPEYSYASRRSPPPPPPSGSGAQSRYMPRGFEYGDDSYGNNYSSMGASYQGSSYRGGSYSGMNNNSMSAN